MQKMEKYNNWAIRFISLIISLSIFGYTYIIYRSDKVNFDCDIFLCSQTDTNSFLTIIIETISIIVLIIGLFVGILLGPEGLGLNLTVIFIITGIIIFYITYLLITILTRTTLKAYTYFKDR